MTEYYPGRLEGFELGHVVPDQDSVVVAVRYDKALSVTPETRRRKEGVRRGLKDTAFGVSILLAVLVGIVRGAVFRIALTKHKVWCGGGDGRRNGIPDQDTVVVGVRDDQLPEGSDERS